MIETEKERFRKVIEEKLAELAIESDLGREGQSVVTLDQQAIGRLSRQDALLSQSMAKATQSRRDTQAARLRQALTRLDGENFGFCDECGEEIAHKRLEFDPGVTLCIGCARG